MKSQKKNEGLGYSLIPLWFLLVYWTLKVKIIRDVGMKRKSDRRTPTHTHIHAQKNMEVDEYSSDEMDGRTTPNCASNPLDTDALPSG